VFDTVSAIGRGIASHPRKRSSRPRWGALVGVVVLASSCLAQLSAPTAAAAAAALNGPIVGMAIAPGGGYWTVGSDGGVFTHQGAGFYGSTGAMHLNRPVVGMAATPSGHGYWLVAADGGIFTFGDAGFSGSTGAMHLNRPVVGMAATPSGRGYWLVAADGGIFTFGDAGFGGRPPAAAQPVTSMSATSTGGGYWVTTSTGTVFAFGDARPVEAAAPGRAVAGMAALPGDGAVRLVSTDGASTVLPPQLRVAVYGNSLASEAADPFMFVLTVGGKAAVTLRVYPGTAICDWFATMRADVAAVRPDVVVMEFSGNSFTTCMLDSHGQPPVGAALVARYDADANLAMTLWNPTGATVIWTGAPVDRVPSDTAAAITDLYRALPAQWSRTEFVDAGAAVEDNGRFTDTLPCLSWEPCTGPVAVNGTRLNVVRAPDGVHFCPVTVSGTTPCPVYSSGAVRFGLAMAAPVLALPQPPSPAWVFER